MNPAIYFLSSAKINKTYVPTPIVIGEQIWDQKNLDTAYYSDGTPIPNNTLTTGTNSWRNTLFGAWRYLSDSLAYGAIYGKLYNYYAVAGIWNTASSSDPLLRKSLAPDGWRVATDADWTALEAYSQTTPIIMLTGTNKLRENASLGNWTTTPNNPGTNSSSFSARGGGYMSYLSQSQTPKTYGYWRTQDASIIKRLSFAANTSLNATANFINNAGFSVRLIKKDINPDDFNTTFISKTTTQISVSGSFGPDFTYTNFTEKGIVYGTGPNPTYTSNQHITADPPTGVTPYNVDILNLTAGILYYIRAYIISGGLKYYANELEVTTGTGNPTVSTTAYTDLSYTTVTSGGNITDDGGSPILERGVCWSTSTGSPLITDSHTSDGDGTGIFESNITGLTPGQKYYYRAYARNAITTSYGAANNSFTTVSQSIVLTTVPIGSNYTNITITSGGTITDTNQTDVLDKGICWNTTGSPTTADSIKSAGPGYDIGVPFSLTADGLSPGVKYYIRAYATNTSTYYGGEVSVTTSIPNVSITTATPSSVNAVSFYCGATVITNPDGYPIQIGYCWGTTNDPVKGLDNFVNDPRGIPFSIPNGTTLVPSTTYYVRAYIITTTQANYITYGLSTSTITLTATPTFTTTAVTSFNAQSITAGGNVTVTNGVTIQSRGIRVVLYNADPATSGTFFASTAPSGDASFPAIATGLAYGQRYNIKAYITNAYGTYYSNLIDQTTSTPNILITTGTVSFYDALNVTCSATSITPDPPYYIDETGYCWGPTNAPERITTPGLKNYVKNPTATTFTSLASGALLTPNTPYYIRAYAINNATGYIAYGSPTAVFTTLTAIPTFALPTSSNVIANAMTISSNVTATNGVPISVRGVVWNVQQNPTIANFKTTNGTSPGIISSLLESLSGNVTYYIRAYVTNAYGTYYSNQISQVTATPQMSISTSAVTNVLALSATSGGFGIIAESAYTITDKGFCWGSNTTPTVGIDNVAHAANPAGTDSFSMDSLSSGNKMLPSNPYYIRAYIYTASANYYKYSDSSVGPFTTLSATPTVTTNAVTAFNALSITAGGSVTDTKGVPVLDRGLCWDLHPNVPVKVTGKFVSAGAGDGTFSGTLITGLTYGTTYNILAYSTNAYGAGLYYATNPISQTTYRPTISITTLTYPTLTTPLSMTCGARDVISDPSYPITEKGYCYSSSVNPPTIANTRVLASPQTGTDSFAVNTGNVLTPNISYYVSAYALNSTTGFVAYGLPATVTTPVDNASSSVTSFTSVLYITATANYNVVASTYYTIGTQGVCWSTSQNPTINSSKTVITGGVGGNFSASLTGLTAGVTYYVRAYVTNAAGTLYSTQSSFATASSPTAYAYSLRKIITEYTGFAILVRRSSDNAQENIGFVFDGTNYNLDEVTLTNFAAGGAVFVVTWYDQSGNNKNITNTLNSRQPRIVLAGAIERSGARAAIRFIAGSGHTLLRSDTSIVLNDMSNYSVLASTSTSTGTANPFGLSATNRFYLPYLAGGSYLVGWGSSLANSFNMGPVSTAIVLFSSLTVPSGGITAWRNNFGAGSTSLVTNNGNSTHISVGSMNLANYFNGYISEIRGYTGLSDRTEISTNINTYYTIY